MSGTVTVEPETTSHPGAPRRRTRRRAGWGVALRIARRDVRRSKGRSALIVALIMLPVLVVVAASTLLRTADLSMLESLPRELGSADAAIQTTWELPEGQVLVQCPDLTCSSERAATAPDDGLSPEQGIAADLGPGTRVIALPSQEVPATVGDRRLSVRVTEAELVDPMLVGMVDVVAGRLPAGPGEVVVTGPLADKGASIGSTMDLGQYGSATVVGQVRSLRAKQEVFATPGGLGVPFIDDEGNDWLSRWLVTAPGGVSWEQVLTLNERGLQVLSRDVIADPPTDSELAADPRTAVIAQGGPSSTDDTTLAVLALILAMVLLEVVLLAGPAFAVGASRQTRALGLVAAQGGTRRQLRRIVLAQAVVLGVVAALTGAALALAVTRAAYPFLADRAAGSIGPFQVGWWDVALVIAFGVASAVLAALVPARAAARLDPVRAIAGRRPQARSAHWHPLLGGAMIAVGATLAYLGAGAPGRSTVTEDGTTSGGDGTLFIAASALLVVLGAVLFAPLAISLLARAARRAPLPGRYALRDMARNQLRTAPAVAAVTAVVAGAVALAIASGSDAAQGRAEYVPNGPAGAAVIQRSDYGATWEPAVWQSLADELTVQVPGSNATLVPVMPERWAPGDTPTMVLSSTDLVSADGAVIDPDTPGAAQDNNSATSRGPMWFGAPVLVGDAGLAAVRTALDDDQARIAEAALADGSAVLLRTTDGPATGAARVDTVSRLSEDGEVQPKVLESFTVPIIALRLPGGALPASVILPDSLVAEAGVEPPIGALLLNADSDLGTADQERSQAALESSPTLARAGGAGANAYVETGWSDPTWVITLTLGVAAGLLALAGSMTAALLALSDARADFATLGAVGAAPRMRRRIAGVYGASIAFLGAVLGVAVGFIPGVAITYPLTSSASSGLAPGSTDLVGTPIPDSFLVIPWGLVAALVLGLPVLVGLVVAAATRSRLPMVARID